MFDELMMKVNNLPKNYKQYKYITVRNIEGVWWFYGAWYDNFEAALDQAVAINGQIMPVAGVLPA